MNVLKLSLMLVLMTVTKQSWAGESGCPDVFNYNAKKLHSADSVNLCDLSGKPMLVVNTASQCGYTSQFKGLEELHKKFGDQLSVVGFPSNDFNQEHQEQEKVAEVCYKNYGVTFTMLEPSHVKGDKANAFYQRLTDKTGEAPNWNFNKYLISADGQTVTHFGSKTKPMGKKMITAVEAALMQ